MNVMAFGEAAPDDGEPAEPSEGLGLSGSEDMSAWVGIGWFLVVTFASALVVALSLPSEPFGLDRDYRVSDVARPDWLLIATFLCYPLQRCARASLVCGFAAVMICSAQSFYVVSTALDRLDNRQIESAAPWLWYVISSAQLICYVGFGIAGARRRVADRRWKRLFTSLMRDAQSTSRRRWRQAH